MALARRMNTGLIVFVILASLPLFASVGKRGDVGASQDGLFANCPATPENGVCPVLNPQGTVTLSGTDMSGNPVTVTIALYDWGFYPCSPNSCQYVPLINRAVLDVSLIGTSPVGIESLVIKGALSTPTYVACDGSFGGLGCVASPQPDGSDVQEPTPISGADTGTSVNTRWDFGGIPPSNPPAPAVPFDQLQCFAEGDGLICENPPLGEAVLVVANSVAQNKLSTSSSNYLVTLTDGTHLGGFALPKSPPKQAQNNTQATAKVISGTSLKDYTDTAQAYPEINPDGSMNYPQGFALAPVPPQSSPSFPSCYLGGETRTFRTIWYSYTAPADGIVTINTAGSRYDTLVYVFPEANPTTTTACDDDSEAGGLQAVSSFNVTKDVQYEVVVYEVPPLAGTYPLSVDGALYFSLKFTTTGVSTTTTTLGASPNPSFSGQGVVFTAAVTPKLPGVPTGTVTFSEGGTNLGASSLNGSGQATLFTSALATGKNVITATYSGDSTYLGSSASEKQVVYAGGTTLDLTSSANPIATGQPVTFTATINTQPSGNATGTVKFKNGTTIMGTVAVSGNTASLTTTYGNAGTYFITATYSGNSFYEPSVSYILGQVVQAATTTTIASSQNPSQNGSPVIFTVTVASTGGTPTGTVQINIPGYYYQSPTLALSAGSAQYTTSLLPVGNPVITASYLGNADFFPSTSPPLNQGVKFPSNFSVLYNFTGGNDGASPQAGLSQDSQGNLYGTTYIGGSSSYGTVFKVSASGQETVLYTFTAANGDGAYPTARPILDAQGNLYGTTEAGGDLNCGYFFGCGTVFKLSPAGSETVLHSFTNAGGDGASPISGLVLDSPGNLYGSTEYGGAYGDGTVFMLIPSGQEAWVYDFAGGSDGYFPSGLTRPDSQGNLFGTTPSGGLENDCGTVFKVTSTGQKSVVYNFIGGPTDGCYPQGGVVRDSQDNLFGATASGGTSYYDGTVYTLTAAGQETILYNSTGPEDGSPNARLVRDSQGNLYGTTLYGGVFGSGTIFKVAPNGQETTLYTFTGRGGVDGLYPEGALLVDSQGNLYGTTNSGGVNGSGMVFKLAPQ
jgi:uncharacterized repeat protein (TIGR03803 family)